jgi:uncharacterized protein DUF4189
MGARARSNERWRYVPLVAIMAVMIATLLIAAAGSAEATADEGKGQQNEQNYNPPKKAKIYGAMWVSPERRVFHFASERDLSGAIVKAGNKCERASTDCVPGLWVKNGYVALAMDTTGNWGTGWGKYHASASAAAVTHCEQNGGVGCQVLRTERTAFYGRFGATQGGLLPVVAGSGGAGGGGTADSGVGGGSSAGDRLNNGIDDVDCPDLAGPIPTPAGDADNLDSDGDGTACE